MTKQEFGMIVMSLQTYYPRSNCLPNERAIELWYNQLNDMDYRLLEASLNKWVSISPFPPTIADLREMGASICMGEQKLWDEGWNEVLSAIRHFGMYQEKEALESMSEVTRKVVERLGFKNLCLSENINADRANFRDIYNANVERTKHNKSISKLVLNQIAEIQKNNDLLLTKNDQ